MIRRAIAVVLFASAISFSAPQLAQGQSPQAGAKPTGSDKAAAYYNFAMGHLYSELAASFGNREEYVNKAIDFYKQALKLDPGAGFLFEELTDLYIQAGKLNNAVVEAEEMLKQDPNNLDVRRILGRIYRRLVGDVQQGKINQEMVKRAVEQYRKITEQDPQDVDSWLVLGFLYRVTNNSVDAEKAYQKVVELDSANEEALTGLAIVYSDLGDTKKAIDMLKLVTDRNPNSRTLAALASSYEQVRDYASAAKILQRALEMSPDNARLKRGLAQDLLLSDQIDPALKLYLELAKAEPRDPQVHLRLAEIYRQKREFDKARASLAKARELDKDSLEIRYDEVNLLEAEGKTDDAITRLKAIIDETAKRGYSASEKSNRMMLLERLGQLYRGANQTQKAVEAFRQIAELDPDTAPKVTIQIIDTYRAGKDMSSAQREADAALKKYPNERMVKLVHASVLADIGNIDGAVGELRALLKGGKDRETQLAIAQIYEKGKRFAEMEKVLAEAEALSESKPDKETIYMMRGAMYEKMKKYDAAEVEFRKVLADNPDNAGALNYLGYMLADRNVRLEEAQKLIARAVELDPNNGAYLDSLGWVFYRLGRLDDAETNLRSAIDRIGKDPTVRDHLGDVFFKQGKIKEAIAQWQASLKEWETTPQSEADPAEVAKITKKLENARVRLAEKRH